MLADIRTYGWHILLVPGDDEYPPYAFSVGFQFSFKHPEVVIFGLDLNVMQRIINLVGKDIEDGKVFEPKQEYNDVIENYHCTFELVDTKWCRKLFGYGNWFYRSSSFPIVQCIWPDKQQRYPWEQDFEPSLRRVQPVLISDKRVNELEIP